MLQDLERRRKLEESLRWDFMALDRRGGGLVSLQDGLALMRMAHGDQFSLHTWNRFIASRGDRGQVKCVDFVNIVHECIKVK